ncbi:MAG: 50S ribosomal protein L5 [Gemmatimonadetes bacterium]|nr:50S ribosomal protein L5 [Gemmatimonadota bacterium]
MATEETAEQTSPEATKPEAQAKPDGATSERPKPEPKKGEQPKGQPKKDKGREKAAKQAEAEPEEAGPPPPPPRLREYYHRTVGPKLMKQFGLTNPHQVPRLAKIVLNVGVGEAPKTPKLMDAVVDELAVITGQRPVVTRAKKSIANFNLRQGMAIGAAVTLRGARMWEFLDRFINVTVPRFRDFRGLSTRSFDGRGSYTIGIKEQMVFPEIDYDKVEKIHGMDITFVTTAGRDDVAMALLRELGMPFRGETPVAVG